MSIPPRSPRTPTGGSPLRARRRYGSPAAVVAAATAAGGGCGARPTAHPACGRGPSRHSLLPTTSPARGLGREVEEALAKAVVDWCIDSAVPWAASGGRVPSVGGAADGVVADDALGADALGSDALGSDALGSDAAAAASVSTLPPTSTPPTPENARIMSCEVCQAKIR